MSGVTRKTLYSEYIKRYPQGGIPIVVSIVSCAPIWPPINHFLKDFVLAGLPQITF